MLYESYKNHLQKVADINSSIAVLSWDQETYMPTNGFNHRAQQIATLSGIAHQLFTDDKFGDTLHKLSIDNSLTSQQKKNVELTLESYNKQKRYTTQFVETLSNQTSQSFNAWQQAKAENNYQLFEPHLAKLIELKKQECDIIGYTEHPYNALLNEYEKGITVNKLNQLFEEVRHKLVPFVKEIQSTKQVDDNFMFNKYEQDLQWNFGIDLLKNIGYDFDSGRQDKSSHPFSISFNSKDVRITTRIDERNLNEMIWSCIHEGGHGLYEQGLPIEEYGLPLGEAIGLGIHESQSRLWENNVGRGLPFWQYHYASLQHLFPKQLSSVSCMDFYKAMNKVQSSLIRTNADEVTYHFHVMIRYEIEKSIFENTITTKELPDYWNEKYNQYLGIKVPSDKDGILQDVHWSHGSFGYFPTYSIGSFYAAQFYSTANKQLPSLENELSSGNTQNLLEWLRENIHKHGKFYTSEELCQKITGEGLNFDYFMEYARKKYSRIYNIA